MVIKKFDPGTPCFRSMKQQKFQEYTKIYPRISHVTEMLFEMEGKDALFNE